MKAISNILKIAGLALLAAFVVTGCIFEPDASGNNGFPAGKGAVSLNINGSDSRTIFPDLTDIRFDITCTPSGGGDLVYNLNDSTTIELKAGTWYISIEAINDEDTTIATAENIEAVIVTGKTTKVNVNLKPADEGPGTLSWTLNYPSGLLTTETLEYSDDNGATWTVLTPTDKGEEELAPGSYLVKSNLVGTAGSAGDLEAFHIYSGLTTAFEWTYDPELLVDLQAFAGSIDIIPGAYASINAVQWEMNGNGGMSPKTVDFTPGTGNTWEFETNIPVSETELWGVIKISTLNNSDLLEYEIEETSAIPYSASVALPAVNVYTVTAIVGANGTLRVNGAVVEDGDKIDFLKDAQVTLAAIGNTGYVVDELLANGVEAVSPITIAADTEIEASFITGSNPNLLWSWSYEDDWVTDGTLAVSTATSNGLPLVNDNSQMVNGKTVSAGARTVEFNTTEGGIVINGTDGGPRFAIGSKNAPVNYSASTWDPNGEFDFSTRRIKITVVAKSLTYTGSATNNFRIMINNNTGTATNTILNNASNTWQATSNTLAEATPIEFEFNPVTAGFQNQTTFETANPGVSLQQALANSFVGIAMTNSAATVLIKSITIEYVGEAPIDPTGIEITNSSDVVITTLGIDKGATAQLKAKLSPEGAVGGVTWASDDASVTFSPATGLTTTITGASVGTANVTATLTGTSIAAASVAVTVNKVDPTAIDITGEGITEGSSGKELIINLAGAASKDIQLGFEFDSQYAEGDVIWSGGGDGVTIDADGKITATAEWTAPVIITATVDGVDGVEDTLSVTVVNISAPTGIEIDSDEVTIVSGAFIVDLKGKTSKDIQLKANILPTGATGTITWESDHTEVITVDTTGKLTAKATGTAIITVSIDDTAFEDTVTVTVVNKTLIYQWDWSAGIPTGATNLIDTEGRWNTGTTNSALPGLPTGMFTSIKARPNNSASRIYIDNIQKGIIIDANTDNHSRLLLGTTYATSVNSGTTNWATTVDGDFDFLTDDPRVTLTVAYQVLALPASASRNIWVMLNSNGSNNLGTTDGSPFHEGGSSMKAVILQKDMYTGVTVGDYGSFAATFDASEFTIGKATLENAFFQIMAVGGTGTNAGVKILIKYIAIEYGDGTPYVITPPSTGGGTIVINPPDKPPANFGDFPAADFDLDTETIITLGSGYTEAEWFIDGMEIEDYLPPGAASELSGDGLELTLDPGDFVVGRTYTLSAVVLHKGQWYSKSVKFTVKD